MNVHSKQNDRSKNKLFVLLIQLFLLCSVSALVRISFFKGYVSQNFRYIQPDSSDYHSGALGIASGIGLYRVDTHDPIFWRTPGYAFFLASFFNPFKAARLWGMEYYQNEHEEALWVQLIISCCIPLLVFFFAQVVTCNFFIASLCGWIAVFHIGFIAAAGFLLSDSLALIPWLLWGILFFKRYNSSAQLSYVMLLASALCFAAYTWIRPQGMWVLPLCIFILLLQSIPWKQKITQALVFILIVLIGISPWIVRNYRLTNKIFYCPMSGPIMQVFSAPKILRRILKQPLEPCWKMMMNAAASTQDALRADYAAQTGGKILPREFVSFQVSWPIVRAHYYMALYDWFVQCLKTAFDLYAYQLVAMEKKIHMYDPLEEYLPEKWHASLIDTSVVWWVHVIAFIEVLYLFFLWSGVIGGGYIFLFPFLTKKLSKLNAEFVKNAAVWISLVMLSAWTIGMTGGFGYARLRLPIEPLLMVLAVIFWYSTLLKRSAFVVDCHEK